MKKTILVFDMDGVLVEPRRYRAALKETLDYFGRCMGWDSFFPGEEVIAWFESRGITSEWDIAPLYLGAAFDRVLAIHPMLAMSPNLFPACEMVRDKKISKPDISIECAIDTLVKLKQPGVTYCDQVLALLKASDQVKIFPNIAHSSLLESLFKGSREINGNLITRVFQEIYLGKEEFENTFHLTAISNSREESLIVDRQLISSKWKQALLNLKQRGAIELVVYTARPSSFSNGSNRKIQYSPEADIVLQQMDWQQVPVIGLGQLEYAAERIGCSSDDLLKPSPAHALGAIGTALSMSAIPSIQAGWRMQNNNSHEFFSSLPELDLHIFEDSPAGIQGISHAAELLKSHGVSVQLTKWGIGSDPNKIASLEQLGATITADVNQALEKIMAMNAHLL